MRQPQGKGDGSDGKANNRLCLATPGYPNTKTPTTNQDSVNVSFEVKAATEWMQPAQDKKRMLFVPCRFVNGKQAGFSVLAFREHDIRNLICGLPVAFNTMKPDPCGPGREGVDGSEAVRQVSRGSTQRLL